MTIGRSVFLMFVIGVILLVLGFWAKAQAHSIYDGVFGKNGQLCCGGDDCSNTIYVLRGDKYEFKTREGGWVTIPEERITFLPIPGEVPDVVNYAHLCYRKATDFDRQGPSSQSVFGDIFLYCAFIPPGAT